MSDDSEVREGGRGFLSPEALRNIKLVAFDVDGVLTDGRIVLDSNGVETKFFNVRDGAGITFLQNAGVAVAIVTGRSSPVVDARARELRIPANRVIQGAAIKLPAFLKLLASEGLQPAQAAYVGDDIVDIPVLESAGLACSPGDAYPEVQKLSHVVSNKKGGKGAVRSICEHILKRRDDESWEKAINRYMGKA